jgi:hypothetical protein
MLRSKVKDCGGCAIVDAKEADAKLRTLAVIWKASALRASALYSIGKSWMEDGEIDVT